MNLHYTAQEIEDLKKRNEEIHFPTSFGFQSATNAPRRGSLHLVIGTTGGGKSTLIRSLIKDFVTHPGNKDHTMLLWLSEESKVSYKTQVAYSVPSCEKLNDITTMSEKDDEKLTEMAFFEALEMFRPDIFIFDNITTSRFYENKKPQGQSDFAHKLSSTIRAINCAAIIIGHTRADVSDTSNRQINIEDIMGGKSLTRISEFAYVLQRFQVKDEFYPTIRIIKHRGQEAVHKLYLLIYDNKSRSFTKDVAIPFEKFKEIFTLRDRI